MRLAVFIGLCLLAGCGDSTGTTGDAGGGGVGGLGGTSGTGGAGGIDLNVWACTEQGIRDAVTIGGGPHTFACDGPTVVTTEATIDIENDVILDGEGNLIVDGDLSHRVFNVSRRVDATLRALTVTRGYASFAGAGIYSNRGNLAIESCRIVGNESDDIAAGIYSVGGSLRVFNSEITDNVSTGGAAIYAGDDSLFEDCTVSRNTGGGIYSARFITVRNCAIRNNTTEFGGGGLANSGQAFISGSTISGNSAAVGGGIFNGGYLAVYSTTIEENTADQGGGLAGFDGGRPVDAVDFDFEVRPGVVDIRYSTIANNAGRVGGGIYGSALRLTVGNSTLSGNVANEDGGGVYLAGTTLGPSTAYFASSTLADNSAVSGTAIFAADESMAIRLSGNIIEGGCAAAGEQVSWSSEGNNIEGPGNTCRLDLPSDRVDTTQEELGLGPLADNGGETFTHLLLAGSVAIDAIPAAACRESLPIAPLIDQRTVERPQGAGCDIGSVEVVTEP